MAIVRLEALRMLEQAITCAIPELEGRVCVGQSDSSHVLEFPSLVIDPRRWRYFPDQALEVFEPAPHAVIMNVGRHESDITIRLGAKTLYQRYELEQKVLDLFLSTPMRPGVLLTQVTACESLGPFVAAYELTEDEWADEKAFSQKFYSDLGILGVIPALVTRLDAYSVQQLQLGISISDNPNSEPSPPIDSPDVELVLVNEDGTIQTVP